MSSTLRRTIHKRRGLRTQNTLRSRRQRVFVVGGLGVSGAVLLGLGLVLSAAISLYAFYAAQLPEPGAITIVEEDFETTKIYDRSGEVLLYEVIDPLAGDRTWAALDQIPQDLRQATIAIEDQSFYTNPGYDVEGIVRAFWNNVRGRPVQGGSSITQQLVKNVLISPEERTEASLERKLKEMILAIQITREYEKDQVLEWYLNTNFYGNLAYGVEAAARVYFDKPAAELSLAESAMLAAIPQSPALNPIDNFQVAKERQQVVLGLMVQQGYISQDEADFAAAQPLTIRPPAERFDLLAPHFSIAARQQLEALVGRDLMLRGGLTVYTTLDYDLQLQVECAARSHVARLSGLAPGTVIPVEGGQACAAAEALTPLPPEAHNIDRGPRNAAVVVTNARTGEVLALLGSLDYFDPAIDGSFNVAFAQRQPGSAFKPFTYLTAFQQGYTPATMVLDVRTSFDVGAVQAYVPENFDRQFHGPVSIRTALANSYNVPAVQVQEWVGVNSTIRTAQTLGLTTLDRGLDYYGLSLSLGGGEVSLLDITYAYSVWANQGTMAGRPIPPEQRRPGYRTLDPTFILRVEDRRGQILWEYGQGNTFNQVNVVEPSLAFLITDILSDGEARRPSVGAGSALDLDRPAAVKTGTTNDYRDNWAVGYTPQIAAGVWVGNTDNSPMQEMPAILGAAPIWHAVMTYAHRDLPVENWPRPPDIVTVEVCETSGLLPTEHCPTRPEIFRAGTEPTAYDNMYQPFEVNRESGLLATLNTPPELIEQRVYLVLPPQAADWARLAGIEQPPTEFDSLNAPVSYGNVAIISPAPFERVRGVVQITGNATTTENFRLFRVDYGAGLKPTSWTQIGVDHFGTRYNGDLETWDTTDLDGLYTLRLTLLRTDGSLSEFATPVTVDNTPPQASITYPADSQRFNLEDEFVVIQPNVIDNIAMDRVEFYVDGELIAVSTVAPYNERWIISGPGTYTVEIRAFDGTGNSTASERVTIRVGPG